MVSAQEPGQVKIYAARPNGDKRQIINAPVHVLAPGGGASEGALSAVVTPEKQVSVASNVVLNNDDILLVSFKAVAVDGIDVSDSIASIPLVIPSGSITLSQADFQHPAAADWSTVAGKEIVYMGYKITEGPARVQGKIYVDLQDDA